MTFLHHDIFLKITNFSSCVDEYNLSLIKIKMTKEVTRKLKSKKDWQYNGQKEKAKKTNSDPQKTTQKTEDWTTRIPPKIGCEHRMFQL